MSCVFDNAGIFPAGLRSRLDEWSVLLFKRHNIASVHETGSGILRVIVLLGSLDSRMYGSTGLTCLVSF